MATVIRTDGTEEEKHPSNGTDFQLKELQQVADGRIEFVTLADGRLMIINEEGKLDGLPFNEAATNLFLINRDGYDAILGDVLVCAPEEVR